MATLFLPLILVALMWVLLVRPQQRRVRSQRNLLLSLEVGDRVVTAGGIVARIVALDESEARLEVAPDTILTFVRPAISRRLDEVEQTAAAAGDAIDAGDPGEGDR